MSKNCLRRVAEKKGVRRENWGIAPWLLGDRRHWFPPQRRLVIGMFACVMPTDANGAFQHQRSTSVQGEQLHVTDVLWTLRIHAVRTISSGTQMPRSPYIEPYSIMPNTHRRRRHDATVELSRVGVGGMYWALAVSWNATTNGWSETVQL